MSDLKSRLTEALSETRTLVLGTQMLLGFQLTEILEPKFNQIPRFTQWVALGGAWELVCALSLLLFPPAFHRLAAGGQVSSVVLKAVGAVIDWVLLFFAVALSGLLFMAGEVVLGRRGGLWAGTGVLAVALSCFYLVELMRPGGRRGILVLPEETEGVVMGQASVGERIEHVVTETRVVLPGAQALLGFQFTSVLMETFGKLPKSSRIIHLASMGFVTLSVILLMTPAAYHRLVEHGELTERFHGVASRLLIAAMVPLSLGISGDLYVVTRKVTSWGVASAVCAAGMQLLMWFLWFGVSGLARRRIARTG